MAIAVPSDLPVHPLSGRTWDAMAQLGLFAEDERVELLEGVPVEMSPQGPRHGAIIQFLNDLWGGGPASVRPQLPAAPSERSRPEPDIALVPRGDYRQPVAPLLVVEVAVSSHRVDRAVKGPIYAAGGAPEYWIVDAPAETVEVRTQPGPGGYARERTLRVGDLATPTAIDAAPLDLAELFAAVRGFPDVG